MFRAPNIKGPRFRKDFKEVLTRDLYNRFIAANPQHTISFENFKGIIKTHSRKMWEVASTERDGIELPIGGSIFVGSTKIRKKNNYDIKASIAANRPIKHRNHNTDGYVAKIYYSPYLSRIGGRDRTIWKFRGGRSFTRAVAREYPEKWNHYIVVADMYRIVNEYKRLKYKNFRTERTEATVKTYNEFEL